MDTDKTYIWKIVIIAQYHSKWAAQYNELIDDIKKSLLTSTVRFFVMTHNVPDEVGRNGTVEIADYHSGNEMPNTANWGECDFYDGIHIKKFFGQVVLPVRSEKLAFITWGHGAGLGYFPPPSGIAKYITERMFKHEGAALTEDFLTEIDEFINVIPAIQYLMANLSKTPAIFNSLSKKNFRKGTEVYSLNMEEFNKTFKVIDAGSLGNWIAGLEQKVNLFISSNCYCQMFEPGYSLRKVADFMVAAQTTYPLFGFDYHSFFTSLQAIKPVCDEDLAKGIVENFLNKYTDSYKVSAKLKDPNFDTDMIHKVSLSANKLCYYDDLLTVINSLATFLIEKNKVDPTYMDNFILSSRKECKDLVSDKNKHGIIDLLHYLEKLKYHTRNVPDLKLDNILICLKKMKELCNKALLRPPSLYKPVEDTTASENPEFLSIYFPYFSHYEPLMIFLRVFYIENTTTSPASWEGYEWDNFVRVFAQKYLPDP